MPLLLTSQRLLPGLEPILDTLTLGDLAHPRVVTALKALSSDGDIDTDTDSVDDDSSSSNVGISVATNGATNGTTNAANNLIAKFATLVDTLRPRDADDAELAEDRFTTLCEAVERDKNLRDALRNSLLKLFAEKKQVGFFADSGILPNSGFFSELWRRVVHRVFPAISDPASLQDNINTIFRRRDDALFGAT